MKEGAVVIDVGIKRIKDVETEKTKLFGDVNFDGKYQFGSSAKFIPWVKKDDVI